MLKKSNHIDDQLDNILSRAWQVRQENFPGSVEFVSPTKTLTISVTGDNCELNCAHCNGVYLRNMAALNEVLESGDDDKTSYLVSGGSDRWGKVPLFECLDELKKLAARGALNLHTGLVSKIEEAACLGDLATVVSFDFVGDNETIAEVYGLLFTVDDYLNSYRLLKEYTRVIPHLCIGLSGGKIKGEYKALELLSKESVEAISMIVFRPTAKTGFSDCTPPPPEEVAHLMATARVMFPQTPLYLGCMRPGGRYREVIDTYALKAGFNKIVLPTPAARRQAGFLGLSVTYSGECCSI